MAIGLKEILRDHAMRLNRTNIGKGNNFTGRIVLKRFLFISPNTIGLKEVVLACHNIVLYCHATSI